MLKNFYSYFINIIIYFNQIFYKNINLSIYLILLFIIIFSRLVNNNNNDNDNNK
jgi:hypothetical protein